MLFRSIDEKTGLFNVIDTCVDKPVSIQFNTRHYYTGQVLMQRYLLTQNKEMKSGLVTTQEIEKGINLDWINCGISFLVTYDEEYLEFEGKKVNKPAFIIVFDLKSECMAEVIDTLDLYKQAIRSVFEEYVTQED